MSVISAILIAASFAQTPEPVLWLQPNGQITLSGKPVQPTFSPGTRVIKTERGTTYDFDGKRSGILLPDVSALAFTNSFTVSTWIYLRSYVNDGPGAQILFRGDDRNGLDPYDLVIHGDGTINFFVRDSSSRGFCVSAEMPLAKWVNVVASWEMPTGQLNLWLNGVNVAHATTSVQPFAVLDKGAAPGFGIGNVQNEKGPHNQPINGQLSDVRILRGVWTPEDLAFRKAGIPPLSTNPQ
jgi:hypothetical protein